MDGRGGAALLLTVLLAAGCSGHATAPAARAQQLPPRTPASTPSASVPPDMRADPQQVHFALVSADGHRVTVSVFGGGCTRTGHLSARETADEVSLDLETFTRADAMTCTSEALVWTESTALAAPVGSRSVVDRVSGKRVHWFDGNRLADVTWLPAGANGPADRPAGDGWARVYQFPHVRSAAPIDVIQTVTKASRPQFTPNPMLQSSSARVHDRPAIVVTQRGDNGQLLESWIRWVEGGYEFSVESVPEWGWQRALPVSRLLRVAEGLRLPAG